MLKIRRKWHKYPSLQKCRVNCMVYNHVSMQQVYAVQYIHTRLILEPNKSHTTICTSFTVTSCFLQYHISLSADRSFPIIIAGQTTSSLKYNIHIKFHGNLICHFDVSLVSTTPSCSQCSTGWYLSGPSPVGVVPQTHGSTTSDAKQSVEPWV